MLIGNYCFSSLTDYKHLFDQKWIPCRSRQKVTEGKCNRNDNALKCWDWRGETRCIDNFCNCLSGYYTEDKKVCIPCPSATNRITNSVVNLKTTTSRNSALGIDEFITFKLSLSLCFTY